MNICFKINALVISLLVLIAIFASSVSYADTQLYVQSARAKLLESPDFKANVVSTVEKGKVVNVVEHSGNWIKVKFHDQVGWVSKLVLSANPPIEKNSVLQTEPNSLNDDNKQKARRRASNTATAAATRGLRADERARASDTEYSDYDALKEVESNNVDEKEVWQFNQQMQPEPSQ